MIIVPCITTYLCARGIEHLDRVFRAGTAYVMTVGFLMLALGAFTTVLPFHSHAI